MLEGTIEDARAGNDFHLVGAVRTIIDAIEDDRDYADEMVESELEEVEEEYPLINAIHPLKSWIEDNDYQNGALPAIEHLEASFQDAKEKGWQNIAVFSCERLLRLRLSIGENTDPLFKEIVEFLESEFEGEDIHLGNFYSLIDLIVEHSDQIDESLLERCLEICCKRREIQHEIGNYRGERDTIEKIIELKYDLDEGIEEENRH